MSVAKIPKPGGYTFDLGNPELAKRIVQADLDLSLDEVGQLSLVVAMNGEKMKAIAPRDLPQEVTFQWQERGLFKGSLVSAGPIGHSQLQLVFQDGLKAAKKTHDNQFMKELTLQEALERLCSRIEVPTKFHGSFSEKLPAFNLAGSSYFEHLQALSSRYGFFFVHRSYANQMCFIRLGSSIKDTEIDSGEVYLNEILHRQGTGAMYSEVNFRHFNSQQLEAKDKKLGTQDLYSPLGAFKEHGGFRERANWKSAKGSHDAHVAQSDHFDSGESRIKNQMAKFAMGQEKLNLTLFEPAGLPGDKLTFKQPPSPSLTEGAYLVYGVHVNVNSAIPKMQLVGIRA